MGNDDNSRPSMYDLRRGPKGRPDIAIECVAAVDPISTETWNLGPARGPMALSTKGDWVVVLSHCANMKLVREKIEGLLIAAESLGLSAIGVSENTDHPNI